MPFPNLEGGPTLYRDHHCEQVIALGRMGKSKVQMAAAIDVDVSTIDNWKLAHPEFARAMIRARDLSMAWWEDQGQNNLCERNFQASLWARSMSVRFPDDYRETNRHEHSGKVGVVQLVEGSSDAEV